MTIHVRHIDEKTVEVTLTPGWFGRRFGAKQRRGVAVRDGHVTWRWKLTWHEVGNRIEREIECATVEDLPRAEARRV